MALRLERRRRPKFDGGAASLFFWDSPRGRVCSSTYRFPDEQKAANQFFFVCTTVTTSTLYLLRIARHKILPRTIRTNRLRTRRLIEMAQRHAQGVGGVEMRIERGLRNGEDAAKHFRHLFFRRAAIARNGLLHLQRGILRYRDVANERGSHRHALRPAQLQHRLHVFPIERSFDGHFVGQILLYQPRDALGNAAQTEITVVELVEHQHAHRDQRRLAMLDAKHAIAHHVRAGVDADDDAVPLHHKSTSSNKVENPAA